jgi:uroporphyrinogen-III synthase
MIGFAAPEKWEAVDAAIHRLAEFDWILFTSQNAVRFFALRQRELGIGPDLPALRKLHVAAVGQATQSAAAGEGFQVIYTAKNQTGESLASELGEMIRGQHVLLPRSDRADERVPNELRKAGARVTEVVAYRTASPEKVDDALLGSVRRSEVDAVVFASPSAVHNLCSHVPHLSRLSQRVQFAAIGPTTARALRESGIRVDIEANESSAAALADAIARHYQRHAAKASRA